MTESEQVNASDRLGQLSQLVRELNESPADSFDSFYNVTKQLLKRLQKLISEMPDDEFYSPEARGSFELLIARCSSYASHLAEIGTGMSVLSANLSEVVEVSRSREQKDV